MLGTLNNVSEPIVMQTLNKEKIQSDPSSSAKTAFVPSSACGVFVHGLEDEFQEVRNAAIGWCFL
jgi:hypothetical protein